MRLLVVASQQSQLVFVGVDESTCLLARQSLFGQDRQHFINTISTFEPVGVDGEVVEPLPVKWVWRSLVEGPDELVEHVTARSIHIGISLAARESTTAAGRRGANTMSAFTATSPATPETTSTHTPLQSPRR